MHPLLQLDEFLEVTNYIRKAHQDGEASHGMESTQMTWVLRANAGPTFHLRMTRYCCVILTSSMPASTRRLHADRKSTRLNSSHTVISYAVFCLKKKKNK